MREQFQIFFGQIGLNYGIDSEASESILKDVYLQLQALGFVNRLSTCGVNSTHGIKFIWGKEKIYIYI